MVLRRIQTGNTCVLMDEDACLYVRDGVLGEIVYACMCVYDFFFCSISHNDIWNVSGKWSLSQGG